jgi:hypothetical protein
MRALTMDEAGFVSGGTSDYWSDPLFGDGGPLMPYSPSIVLGGTNGYGPVADDSIFSTGGVEGFGGGTCPPASVESQQIGAITGAIGAARTVLTNPLMRLVPPQIMWIIITGVIVGGAAQGVMAARITAKAECWLRDHGPLTS